MDNTCITVKNETDGSPCGPSVLVGGQISLDPAELELHFLRISAGDQKMKLEFTTDVARQLVLIHYNLLANLILTNS